MASSPPSLPEAPGTVFLRPMLRLVGDVASRGPPTKKGRAADPRALCALEGEKRYQVSQTSVKATPAVWPPPVRTTLQVPG